MPKKLLVISGQTATGKTTFAQDLAKKYHGALISADSGQIYQGLDIGTGKDHDKSTEIYLTDIITPKVKFSSYDFASQASRIVTQLFSQNKLPIIVGGTGYYIYALLHPEDFQVGSVHQLILFRLLNLLPVTALQKVYQLISPNKYSLLNNSERHNPHRLVKRILLATSKPTVSKAISGSSYDILHIHLYAPPRYLHSKIQTRINTRLQQGLLGEIKSLLSQYSWSDPGLKTIAYQEFQPFFDETDTLENCINNWFSHEKQYSKRQATYFKKYFSTAITFNVSESNWQKSAQKTIAKWYNQ